MMIKQLNATRAVRPACVSRSRAVAPRALLSGLKSILPGAANEGGGDEGFYSFKAKDIDGKTVPMSSFKGKAVLVVNTASACGFTPQYAELQEVYDKYKAKGLVVAAWPCNQFGKQEPGSNAQIKSFAKSTYSVTFPLFSKVDVNGPSADPLFDFLKSEKGGLFGSNDIKWNFTKFLVDKQGNVVGRYAPTTTPASLAKDIEKALA